MPFVSRDKETLQRILRNLIKQEKRETEESKLSNLNYRITVVMFTLDNLSLIEKELLDA